MRRLLLSAGLLVVGLPPASVQAQLESNLPPVVGRRAPEIVGEDIDGKKLRLSDFRGKVVLLDFWGNW
jgi:hypothetical protein